MRRTLWLSLALAALVCLTIPASAADKKPGGKKTGAKKSKAVKLFNSRNLDGWDCFLVEPGVEMKDVWSVEDGVLVCKGEPLGYLYTEKEFTNYRLTVEWRWAPGGEPGNSGVLLRIVGDAVSFLPRCVEAQLMHGSAGDIWAFYGAKIQGDEERFKKIEGHEKLGDFAGVGKIKDAEKEPGQWNKYVITLDGSDLTLMLNGKKVNEATGLEVVPGRIGLQSEGGRIEFRTVRLVPLGQ